MRSRLLNSWRSAGWHLRLAALEAVLLAAVAIFCALALKTMDAKNSAFAVSQRGTVLGRWLAESNRDALATGRPELANFDACSNYGDVKDAVLFDAEGKIAAPASLYGDRFGDLPMFKNILGGKRPFIARRGGEIEFFVPVIGAGSAAPAGLVYFSIANPKGRAFPYIAICAAFLLLAGAAFYLAVRKDFEASAEGVRKCAPIIEAIGKAVAKTEKELAVRFEFEWRKLIHSLPHPCIVLDKDLRLVDASSGISEFIAGGKNISEGKHIFDILSGSRLLSSVEKALTEVSKGAPYYKDEAVSAFPARGFADEARYVVMPKTEGLC